MEGGLALSIAAPSKLLRRVLIALPERVIPSALRWSKASLGFEQLSKTFKPLGAKFSRLENLFVCPSFVFKPV
jgi:hypothetical protein